MFRLRILIKRSYSLALIQTYASRKGKESLWLVYLVRNPNIPLLWSHPGLALRLSVNCHWNKKKRHNDSEKVKGRPASPVSDPSFSTPYRTWRVRGLDYNSQSVNQLLGRAATSQVYWWLIDRLNACSLSCLLVGWSIHWLIDWIQLVDWLINCHDWLADYLNIDWLIN